MIDCGFNHINSRAYRAFGMYCVQVTDVQIEVDGIYFGAKWLDGNGKECCVSLFLFLDNDMDYLAISLRDESRKVGFSHPQCYSPDELFLRYPGIFKLILDALGSKKHERTVKTVEIMKQVSVATSKHADRN